MDHRELAAELFLSDSNCAQAVLEAFGDVTGLEKSLAGALDELHGIRLPQKKSFEREHPSRACARMLNFSGFEGF